MSGHLDDAHLVPPQPPETEELVKALRFYADERNWLNDREIRGFPGFHGRRIAVNALARRGLLLPAEHREETG